MTDLPGISSGPEIPPDGISPGAEVSDLSAQTEDLRKQVALAFKVRSTFGEGTSDELKIESAEIDYGQQIDAVLAVFQPVLDKLQKRIDERDALLRLPSPEAMLLRAEAVEAGRTYAEMEAHHLAEIERLREAVAHYENTLTWHTTCHNCAHLLDSCYAETMRAERFKTAWASARIGRAKARERADTYEQAFRRVCEAEGIREGHLDLMTQMRDSERGMNDGYRARAESAETALARVREAHEIHRVAHPNPVGGCAACHMGAALGRSEEGQSRG